MKRSVIIISSLMLILLIGAGCASNKTEVPEVVEPPRNPLQLARDAAGNGLDALDENSYMMAIESFNEAISLFEEAAPVASEQDSIAQNIERMKLNLATTHTRLAKESFDDQIFPEAITHYNQALDIYNALEPITISPEELSENKMQLYSNLAITNQRARNFEEAIRFYDMILAVEPDNVEVLNFKFHILNSDIGDQQRAFQVLKNYAEASNDANAYLLLANNYAEAGDNEQAGLYYERALEIRPDSSTYRALGNFYRSTQQWSNSNEVLMRLIETNPGDEELVVVYKLMGDNYNKLGNRAKMAEYFEKAIAIKEDGQLALAVASYYNGASNWNKVIQFATITLRNIPRNADALLLRGNAYYRTNRFNEARVDLEQIRNDPRHGTNATNLLNAIANRRP